MQFGDTRPERRASRERKRAPAAAAPPSAARNGAALHWEIAVPLVTNPVVVGGLAKVFALTGFAMAMLFGGIAVFEGEWRRLPTILIIAGATAGGLFVFSIFVSMLIYGNRMKLRCSVDRAGAETLITDRRSKAIAAITAVAGLLTGRPSMAGTGVLAAVNIRQRASWKDVVGVRFDPRRHSIALRSRWRTLAVLFCSPKNYDTVADRVRTATARPGILRAAPAR